MCLFLLDDQGEIWRGDSRRLRVAFDSPFSGGEFIDYSVKNLGFVAINVYGSSCQLRFRPSFVGEKAARGMLDWLRSNRIQRVVLSSFDKGWRDKLMHRSGAEAHIEALLAPMVGERRPDDLLKRPQTSAALAVKPIIADIYESWPNLVETYDVDTLVNLLKSAFNNRYVIVNKEQRVSFKEFGDKMFPGYDPWRTCAIGAPVEEQPDRAYGRWCAESYRLAVEAGEQRIEDVDAIMRCPVKGRSRFRYRRVILPFSKESSGTLAIGGSFDDDSVDLRVPTR